MGITKDDFLGLKATAERYLKNDFESYSRLLERSREAFERHKAQVEKLGHNDLTDDLIETYDEECDALRAKLEETKQKAPTSDDVLIRAREMLYNDALAKKRHATLKSQLKERVSKSGTILEDLLINATQIMYETAATTIDNWLNMVNQHYGNQTLNRVMQAFDMLQTDQHTTQDILRETGVCDHSSRTRYTNITQKDYNELREIAVAYLEGLAREEQEPDEYEKRVLTEKDPLDPNMVQDTKIRIRETPTAALNGVLERIAHENGLQHEPLELSQQYQELRDRQMTAREKQVAQLYESAPFPDIQKKLDELRKMAAKEPEQIRRKGLAILGQVSTGLKNTISSYSLACEETI